MTDVEIAELQAENEDLKNKLKKARKAKKRWKRKALELEIEIQKPTYTMQVDGMPSAVGGPILIPWKEKV